MANAPSRRRLVYAILLPLLAVAAGALLLRRYTPAPEPNELRWGGDAAGGAPFIYGPDEQRVGFEVDLADYLGKQLGRTPRFVQGDWDALPDTLSRGDIDVAMNGMEYLPDREKEFPSTVPYYVYTLRLIARAGDDSIRGWDDLKHRPGRPRKRVGVLRGTVAERYLRDKYGKDVEVLPTREVVESFQLVEGGERLDATVQDSPAASFYIEGGRFGKLRVVGEPVAPGYYVLLTRKDDRELRQNLNDALKEAIRSGELERILRKYNLWSPEQEKLRELAAKPWPPSDEDAPAQPTTRLTLGSLAWPLVKATGVTIALACCSMPLAILLGLAVAVGRLYGPRLLAGPLTLWVEVLRGTPLLLQLYVLFFLLPQAARWTGWEPLVAVATLPPFVVGVLGLAINYSAYESEIYRAGLLAIPRGQMEAAL